MLELSQRLAPMWRRLLGKGSQKGVVHKLRRVWERMCERCVEACVMRWDWFADRGKSREKEE